MATIGEATIVIHLHATLNGEPITEIIEAPARMEEMTISSGLHVYLDIDAQKLAKAILPHIPALLRNSPGRELTP